MDVDILKAYLVKLGVQIDTDSFNKVTNLLNELEKLLGKTSTSGAASFVRSAGVIAGALAVIDGALMKTIQHLAKTDLEYQLLAQRMYISVDAAKAFKIATDTLGHSLKEVAWNAELKAQYFELVKDINDLKVPQEAKDMFKQVRGISFEFDRMKMMSGRAIELIAYNLLKLNKGEVFSLSENLKKFNEYIKKNLPEWSKQIADFLQPIVQVTTSFVNFLKDIWNYFAPKVGKILNFFKEKWESISVKGKERILLIGMAIMSLASRLGLVASALLLIDDYMAFKEGRKSMPFMIDKWQKLQGIIETVEILSGGIAIAWDHIINAIMRTGKYTGKNEYSLEQHLKDWRAAEESRKRDALV